MLEASLTNGDVLALDDGKTLAELPATEKCDMGVGIVEAGNALPDTTAGKVSVLMVPSPVTASQAASQA